MSNDFSDLSIKIKQLRKDKGLSLEQVGQAVGVGKSTVRKWETGDIANMRRDKIIKLAKFFDVTPGYLLGWEQNPSNSVPILNHVKNTIPLIGEIACGSPILAEDNIVEMLPPLPGVTADMALTCEGDSMQDAGIFNGDIAYIKLQPVVSNGDICAVRIGDEATLKRYSFDGTRMILHPENKKYPDMIYQGTALADVKILGKLVGVVRRF